MLKQRVFEVTENFPNCSVKKNIEKIQNRLVINYFY